MEKRIEPLGLFGHLWIELPSPYPKSEPALVLQRPGILLRAGYSPSAAAVSAAARSSKRKNQGCIKTDFSISPGLERGMARSWMEASPRHGNGIGDFLAALMREVDDGEPSSLSGDYIARAEVRVRNAGAAGGIHASHPVHALSRYRAESVDLLYRICENYRVSGETVCASTVVQDRFLAAASITAAPDPCFHSIAKLAANPSLVAVTCFLVTCKFREILCPLLQDLEQLTGTRCSSDEIRAAEVTILAAIDWDLHCVTGPLRTQLCSVVSLCETMPGLPPGYPPHDHGLM